ncbi:MAG TPA: hypothetical protein VN648_19405 [Candidatus Methylomirabilis sp.]|nr:hypothetical protein [Candidatus Methylomirabilis sp.]
MCSKLTTVVPAGTVAFGMILATGLMAAYGGHDHAGASHGGAEAKTKRHHFEAVFAKAGLRLYVHRADHKPIDVSGLNATATFYYPNSQNAWFTRKLHPAPAGQGQVPTSLELVMDLSRVPTKGASVAFQVSRLPDPGEPTATFTVPFTLADDAAIVVTKSTTIDENAIAAQKVCPVSGEELGGEMGPPVKVTRGGSSIFLCCKNCLKQVRANPDKFFSASATPHRESGHHDH